MEGFKGLEEDERHAKEAATVDQPFLCNPAKKSEQTVPSIFVTVAVLRTSCILQSLGKF